MTLISDQKSGAAIAMIARQRSTASRFDADEQRRARRR